MSLLVWAALANAACAAVLALVAVLVGRRCRRPAVLHALWLLVLVKLVTPPLWPVRLGWLAEDAPAADPAPALPPVLFVAEVPASQDSAAGISLPNERSFPEKTAPLPPSRRQVAETKKGTRLVSDGNDEKRAASPFPVRPASLSDRWQPETIPATPAASGIASLLGVVWLAGSAVWLACIGVRIVRFHRLLRHAPTAPEDVQKLARRLAERMGLTRCPAVRLLPGPLPLMVWAVGRPVVFFPAGLLARLNDEERASLLTHELAHIRRRDHWVRWLEMLVLSLYWWYPLAWWARKQLQEREEECCDAWVVAESSPRVYALAILAAVDFLAEVALPLPAVASALGGKEILKRRLTLIMTGKTPGRLSRAGLAAVLAVCAALPLAPAPGAPEKKSPDQPAAPAQEAQPAAVALDREPIQFDPNPTTFQPLDGKVWSVAVAPDGKTVASVGGLWDKPGELVIWDAASGKPRARVRENVGMRSVAFSPDGKTLATAGYMDQTAKVREAATGKVLHVLMHQEGINGVSFSPDGKTLATAGLNKTVTLWDLESGKRKAELLSPEGSGVYCVAFSPDGKAVVSCGGDLTARVWDVATGKERAVLKGHAKAVEYATFSPDGKLVATASWDGTIKLWDATSGEHVFEIGAHTLSVLCLAFSPDGKMLASGSGKWGDENAPEQPGEIKLWDVASRKEVASLKGHEDRVWSVSFSADGKTLATGGWDKTVRLWDVAGRKEKAKLKLPEPHAPEFEAVLAGALAPETNLLALGTDAKTIHLLDAATCEVRHVLEGHADAVTCLAFAPGGKLLASGSPDYTIKLWDPAAGKEVRTLKGHTSWVHGLAFAPDGKTLASGAYDKTVRLWEVATGKERRVLKGHTAAVRAVAFALDGKRLATAGSDRTIKLWDLTGDRKPVTLKAHEGTVRALAFSPDGKKLASAGEDGLVKLWDPATGEARATLKGHADAVLSLAFSPRGGLLAAGGQDQTVRVWDVATGQLRSTLGGHGDAVTVVLFAAGGWQLYSAGLDRVVRRWYGAREAVGLFEGHTGPIRRMALSRDGTRLLSASGWPRGDRTLRLWAVPSGKLLLTLEEKPQPGAVHGPREQAGEVYAVAISPDGKRGLSGGYNNVVHVWDLEKGMLLHRLEGHKGTIYNVAFSPDGRQAASGSRDGSVRLWEVETGKEVRVLRGHGNGVESVVYSPDGRRLLTAGYNRLAGEGAERAVRVWDVETGKELHRFEGMRGGWVSAAWMPDGRRFVLGAGQQVQVWDVEESKVICRIQAHPAGTTCVSVSADGKQILSSGHGGSARLWDVETGRELKHLQGHRGFVMSVLFTPDGWHALTAGGGDDFAIRLWELPTPRP
jgi:WD40 repeat protein/beta-lactamase regulating signal transducer with metallopeptidase domain